MMKETLKNFFLKTPIKFSRITSRFTMQRFHPVQHRWKAHKGTDYAVPEVPYIHDSIWSGRKRDIRQEMEIMSK
jgi:hypothetical protein